MHLSSSWRMLSATLILCALGTRPAHAQESLADTIERCERSVVRIEVKMKDGSSLGSGFVIAPKTIATNVHVLMGAQEARAVFPNGQQFTITGTVRIDSTRDIALARIDGPDVDSLPILPLSTATARKGEQVVALGSPLGLSFTATSGVVSAIRDGAEITRELHSETVQGEAHRGSWIQLDAALSPGNSGGPVINNAGQVVAMSTLASQGAQNLNFGISSQDISQVLSTVSNNAPLTSLGQGVGAMESKEGRRSGAGGGGSGESVVDTPDIPRSAIEAYVSTGRTDFRSLKRDLVKEVERLRSLSKEMSLGQTAIPAQLQSESDIVRARTPRGYTWYFRNKAVKDSVVGSLQAQIRDLNKLSQNTGDEKDANALLLLLTKFGPPVDTRLSGSVGFLSEATVLHAYNGHDTMVVIDDAPYILVMESTAGLSLGAEILPTPVYVCGTETARLPNGRSMSITVLKQVSGKELRDAVLGSSGASDNALASAPSSGSPSFGSPGQSTGAAGAGSTFGGAAPSGARMWYDKTGSFSVEAVLLEATDSEVVLRKTDGKILRVPRSKLSEADQRYLRQ